MDTPPRLQRDPSRQAYIKLGLPITATEEEIRSRYLELIKLNPPESDPERFQEIQQAYQTAIDPLPLIDGLLALPKQATPWQEIIEHHRGQRPPLETRILLALGNQDESQRSDSAEDSQHE